MKLRTLIKKAFRIKNILKSQFIWLIRVAKYMNWNGVMKKAGNGSKNN